MCVFVSFDSVVSFDSTVGVNSVTKCDAAVHLHRRIACTAVTKHTYTCIDLDGDVNI